VRTLQLLQDDLDALASDGRPVHLRDLVPDDAGAVRALHDAASDQSIYLRFFTTSRESAVRYAAQLTTPDPARRALGAFAGSELIGVGCFERIDERRAEFALLVADAAQHGGIGTLLLEHLIAEARSIGIERFVAEVLAANATMLDVIRNLGFQAQTRFADGEEHIEFELDVAESVIAAIGTRERSAQVASLRPLLAPRSVAVIGAGRRPGSVGHEVLINILNGGFRGTVYAVNPKVDSVLGLPSYASPLELPETPDLAVIALPAALVKDAVGACGQRGIRAGVLLGAGFSEAGATGAALQDEVLRVAREHGMRLIGPNCIGVVNTDPEVSLNATFAAAAPTAGKLAVLAQSGAFGAALLEAAKDAGTGVAQFVSVGNKIDVGGNDLLLAWQEDPSVAVIAGYLESVGDPRRFARIARQVSRTKPVLLVKSGRTEAGQLAGRSHTAAAASSDIAIDALFRSSGVIRVAGMRQLLDAARVLAEVPLPGGPRVAIIGNSGGPEILAVDAAVDAGLVPADFDPDTATALAQLGVPGQNPIDLGAAVQPDTAAAVLRLVTDSLAVDAVITVFTDVSITDSEAMGSAIAEVAATTAKPVIAVRVGAPDANQPLPDTDRQLPRFRFPEDAAAALGVAWQYARDRSMPDGLPVRPGNIDATAARSIVEDALADARSWLETDEAFQLLAAYGVPVCAYRVATDLESAVAAGAELGYPLAVKVAKAGAHKTEMGGVRLGIADEVALRAAATDLLAAGGAVLLQPMISHGTELIVGAVHDPQCGPLVMLGAGGVLTDILGDRAFGLAPLTDTDAAELIARLRAAPLLDGFRGAPVIDRSQVRDVLVRIGTLVDDLPEIAELDINPFIARADGLMAVDARIRVSPPPSHPDPLVRQLRGPRRQPS
jgi:acyl-CoA synthetase (NDP forming)/RimJ/RimL family protein N-acetyltransferase